MIKTINIIGCGRVGKLFGRLLQASGEYCIQQLYSRNLTSAEKAQAFIGGGEVATHIAELKPADIYCLSVHDDAIVSVCNELVSVKKQAIVFHCSGALAAQPTLQSAIERDARVGSLHPALNISDAAQAADIFSGTYCAVESNDLEVLAELQAMVKAMGGRSIVIDATDKLIYHAALVMASNYTLVLVQTTLEMLGHLNISEAKALALLKPLLKNTVDRVLVEGGVKAATGPIVRGECDLVEQQLAAITDLDPVIGALYCQLGLRLVEIADQRAELDSAVFAKLRNLFRNFALA